MRGSRALRPRRRRGRPGRANQVKATERGLDQLFNYQEVSEQLRADGFAGLVAPSGARPAGRVLCVLVPTAAGSLMATDPPRRVDEPPAPPRGLTT